MEEISLYDLPDLEINNYEMGVLVKKQLKEKYSQEFLVKCLGERYGTDKFDELTAYCSPEEKNDFVFTVKFDMVNEQIIDDDYFIRKNCFELEESIQNIFKQNNIESLSKVEVFGKNKIDCQMAVEDFIKTYPETNYLAIIIIKDNELNNSVEEIFESIAQIFNGIHLKTIIYSVDKDDFNIFIEKSKILPSISTTFIEKYNIKKQYYITIKENRIIRIK